MKQVVNGRIGLIGDPVDHSLSPVFQQAAFDFHDLPVTYELWQTSRSEIPDRLEALRRGSIAGANVTVPHKEAFFEVVDLRSPTAERARAVNTLLMRDGRLYGDNTDVYGFIQSLKDRNFVFEDVAVLVIGAGGAAHGVVAGLLDEPVGSVVVTNRTIERAKALDSHFNDIRIRISRPGEISGVLPETRLIVNATAIGWHGNRLPVDPSVFSAIPTGAIAYDLTYRQTPFLSAADAAGLATIDGLPMLVHQGARSFRLWTGLDAPVELMMRVAAAARDAGT